MDESYNIVLGDTVGRLDFEIPRPVAEALKDGKVLLSTTVGKNGITAWVQFMDSPGNHITYDLVTAGEILGSLQRGQEKGKAPSPPTSGKMVAFGQEVRHLPIREDRASPYEYQSPPVKGRSMTYEQATEHVVNNKLGWHRTNGLLNAYPTDSLVKQDFSRKSNVDFIARATVVARAIGEDKVVSRIASGRIGPRGCLTLHQWWDSASAQQRAKVLVTQKKFGARPHLLDDAAFCAHLAKIECPFQETALHEASDEESGPTSPW